MTKLKLIDYLKSEERLSFRVPVDSYGNILAYITGDIRISNIPQYSQLTEGLNNNGNIQTQRNSSILQINNQKISKETFGIDNTMKNNPVIDKIVKEKNRSSSTAYLEQSQKKLEDDLIGRISITIKLPNIEDFNEKKIEFNPENKYLQ